METGASIRSGIGPERVALVGLGVNALLGGGKLLAGLLGRSSALVADAIESLGDVASSLVVVVGMRYARRPPDESHPYGHGKAEAVAALVVAAFLLLASAGIAVHAVHEILIPHAAPAGYTLAVLLAVVALKEWMFRVARRAAGRAGSSAGAADAFHHRSDALTSLAAAVGIGIAIWGPAAYVIADEIAALVASGVIAAGAVRQARGPLGELLDEQPGALAALIREAASTVEGVRGVEKVLARKSGRGYLVDMHLHVDGDLPLREAHAIGGRVRATVRARVAQVRDVLVHVEPATGGPMARA